ncbi:MAG: V-type ATP synthase subunit I, partial [Methanomethylophilus sp.]
MLLPESMSRIVIVGTKSRLDDAIEALYSEKSIHVIDHTTGDDKLSIGAPRPNTSKASERLLKVRGMEKELGVVKHTKTPRVSVEDTRSQINAGNVEDVESQVLKAVDERNDLNQKITELNSRKNTLELLQKLPITMDLYSGYKSLAVLVGTVSTDPTTALQAVDGCECFVSMEKKTGVAAVFVRMNARATALTALTGCGFTEVHVPEETKKVLPAEAIAEIDEEIGHYQQQLDAANLSLEALRSKYAAFLKGTDEELSIE